jgi:hypothetical protein
MKEWVEPGQHNGIIDQRHVIALGMLHFGLEGVQQIAVLNGACYLM